MLPDFSLAGLSINSNSNDIYQVLFKTDNTNGDDDITDTKYEEIRIMQPVLGSVPSISRAFTIEKNVFKNHIVGIYSGI